MKYRNTLAKYGRKLGAVGAVSVAATGQAFADATAATASLTSVTSDVSTIGWAVMGVLIVAAGFKYLRRAL